MNRKELHYWRPLNNQGNPTGSFCYDWLQKTVCDFSFHDSKIDILCTFCMCISTLCNIGLKSVSSQMENLLESTDPRGRVLLCRNSYINQIGTYILKLRIDNHFFVCDDLRSETREIIGMQQPRVIGRLDCNPRKRRERRGEARQTKSGLFAVSIWSVR